MKALNENYTSREIPTYEEILQLERRGMELRSQELYSLFSSVYGKVRSLLAKGLHIDFHKDHNKLRVS